MKHPHAQYSNFIYGVEDARQQAEKGRRNRELQLKYIRDNKMTEKQIEEQYRYSRHEVWEYISKYQTLSEDFIRGNKLKVEWAQIEINQKLSDKFLIEMIDFIEIQRLPYRVRNRPIYQKLAIMKKLGEMV